MSLERRAARPPWLRCFCWFCRFGVVLWLSSRDITRLSYVAVGTINLKEGPARGLGMLPTVPPWPAPHLWSAWGNIPIGLGNEVIRRCILDACGRDGRIVSAFVVKVPKRNARARGPRRPKGSMAKGSSVIFRCSRSPIMASPLICVPVAGSRLLPRHNFLFSKIWRCFWVVNGLST